MTLIIINNSDIEANFGESVELQIYKNGRWNTYAPTGEVYYRDIANILKANSRQNFR